MSELKQLNQLTPLDAQDVSGGAGDCPATATIGTTGVGVTSPPDSLGNNLISTYEGVIQATSYALERVINAVSQ